jgi:hypothetical protein
VKRKNALAELFPRLDPPIGVLMRQERENVGGRAQNFYGGLYSQGFVREVEKGKAKPSLDMWLELLERSKWEDGWDYLRSGLHISLSVQASALHEICEAYEGLSRASQTEILKALSTGLFHTPQDLATLMRQSTEMRVKPEVVWFLALCVAFSDEDRIQKSEGDVLQ